MRDLFKRAMVKSKKERKIDRVNSRYAFLKRKKSLIMKLRERTKQKKSRVSLSLSFSFSFVIESARRRVDEGIWRAPYSSPFFKVSTIVSFFERSLSLSLRFASARVLAFNLFICGRGEFFLDVTLESKERVRENFLASKRKGKEARGVWRVEVGTSFFFKSFEVASARRQKISE
jgi:hypothetical protein